MKGYKLFILVFITLLAVYIVAEINRPKQIDWKMTLSSKDKNPYGAYILYEQLHNIFPKAAIRSYNLPVYNQLNNLGDSNTAYLLIDPEITMSAEDIDVLLNYVIDGNYVFLSSGNINKLLSDTLKVEMKRRFDLLNQDSVTINFTSPVLRAEKNYGSQRMTLDGYFNKFDTATTVVLGKNHLNDVNFIRMPYGEGAFFIHALPLCFSNYFMLRPFNSDYTAKALSYLPPNIHTIFWDEYYKRDDKNIRHPLRYILNNQWLRAAYYLGLLTILLFIFFEMKRRQRVIAVMAPLRNSSLDFVQTVGNVYFNKRDNKNISTKKINYFLAYIRAGLFLSTSYLNDEFVRALSKKTSVPEEKIRELVSLINEVQQNTNTNDAQLLELNWRMEEFYG